MIGGGGLGRRALRAIGIVAVWAICLSFFFPILYMVLTSFKQETEAIPPRLFFAPTLENYRTVLASGILPHILNSAVITLASMASCILLGVPAAYAIVFGKLRKPDSTFLLFKYLNLLDSRWGMILIYTGANIPIAIWMVRSFLKDIPRELLEAADIDGATRVYTFFRIILPLARTGIISTALLVFIFVWNEFFFAVNLTYVDASTIPVYMASYMTQEGLFWAKLSAISTLTILPPLALGWVSHKVLVRGIMMGAVKG
jgi:sorbitol/mannitol transport system permease protein